jgi:RNA polymerase sigma-70 factor (ECF subfamily)
MSVAELPTDLASSWPTRALERIPGSQWPASRSRRRLSRLVARRPPPAPPPQADFSAVLVDCLPELTRRARRLTGRATLAEDLVQETCRRALEARAQFRRGTDPRAWLMCILRNLFRDHMRRAPREILIGDVADTLPAMETPMKPIWMDVSDEEVALALSLLPPIYRQPYLLHAIQGKSYAEVARELGLSTNTVGTRLLRARHQLRRFLLQRREQGYR